MKTKTIFKTLALFVMMPAMMLTTACSSDDDAIINNNETPAKKGYTLPVTINVTRQSEAATRATYTDNGNKTGSLSFSSGDQLFVYGEDDNAGQFAGTLTWVSGETFSGTITTENYYSGTANDLFSSASSASSDYYLIVELLPNGYETYGFFSITEKDGYNDELNWNYNNTFATTKALAVEQFSWEWTDEYDNGFALSPGNSILNFTISGLTAYTEVNVALTGNFRNITGEVTTDGSGTATFAIGVPAGVRIEYYSLTVGGNAITLPEKLPEPGKIYNISRSVGPAYTMAADATAEDLGKVIGADGNIYADAAEATAAGTTAEALICYVGAAGTADASSATYKGLALALTDAGTDAYWCGQTSATCLGTQYNDYTLAVNEMAGIANTNALVSTSPHSHAYSYSYYGDNAATLARNYKSGTHPTGTSDWFLPSLGQWYKMITATSGYENLRTNASLQSDNYWSSTEHSAGKAWGFMFSSGYLLNKDKFSPASGCYVRSALAF